MGFWLRGWPYFLLPLTPVHSAAPVTAATSFGVSDSRHAETQTFWVCALTAEASPALQMQKPVREQNCIRFFSNPISQHFF